jgi:hypothetical protein
MPTGAKTDPKISPIVEVKKRVTALLKEHVKIVSSSLWALADEAAYLRHTLSWNKKEVDFLFLEAYEKALGVIREKMDKRQYQNFRNECQRIYQVTSLTFQLTSARYDTERKSGKAFYRVWSEHNNNYSEAKAKKRTTKAKSKAEQDQELADEVKDGVVNADEYVKATVNTSPKKKVRKGEEEELTSWTAKPYNEEREIKKGLAALLRTPEGKTKFVGIIQFLVNKQLLPEDWANLAEGLTI